MIVRGQSQEARETRELFRDLPACSPTEPPSDRSEDAVLEINREEMIAIRKLLGEMRSEKSLTPSAA